MTGVLVFVLNWSPTPATGIAVYDRVDTASRLMSFTNVFATTVKCTTEGTMVEWKARTFDAPAQLFFYDTEFDTSIPLLLSYYSPAAAFEISNQAFF